MTDDSNVKIAIDTQCCSYFIDTLNSAEIPIGVFSEEKIALIRIFVYMPNTFYLTPTLIKECIEIPNIERKQLHDNYNMVMMSKIDVPNSKRLESLIEEYLQYHSGVNDCKILAEAALTGLDVLLSYDTDFIKHLSGSCKRLRLIKPSDFWAKQDYPNGIKENKSPHCSNPLFGQLWYKW